MSDFGPVKVEMIEQGIGLDSPDIMHGSGNLVSPGWHCWIGKGNLDGFAVRLV